jgi:hypothetical protein
MAERMTRGQRKFSGAKKKMAENALMGGERIPKFIYKKTSRGTRKRLNPEYKAIYGSANLKNRPVKIDNKGLTPARTLAKGESKIRRSDMMKGRPPASANPEVKKKKKIDLRKKNLAGVRMGQRKAGGMIKKMAYGGKVKKMMDGGTAMKDVPAGKEKSLGKLPTEVRNKMGFKKAGGKVKKMMGGGMAMKYGHGGKVGKKCPRDGIAMKGKTRA